MLRIARRAVLGAAATGLLAGPAAAAPKIGQPAPDFTVTTFDGQKVSRADLAGKVILLNFWATWCAPCRIEMPELDAYLRRLKTEDLKIYAVTTEGSVPNSKLKPLTALLSFPLASKIAGRGYAPIKGAVPSNFVIDRAGVLRYAKAGSFNAKSLEALISPLLKEPPPAPAPTDFQST